MNSNMPLEYPLELDRICRSCMSKKGDMRPLYGSCLDDMLKSVAEVDVQAGDGLPELLCFQCVLQVSRAFRFKQQCERSDATLRTILLSNNQTTIIEEVIPDTISSIEGHEPEDRQIIETTYCTEDGNTEKCLLILQDGNDLINFSDQTIETVINDDDIIETDFNESLEINENEYKNMNLLEKTITIQEFENEQINTNDDEEIEEISTIYSDNFGCETCGFLANNQIELDDHINSIHKTIFQCDVCKKTFSKRRILNRHLKIHNPIKPHICEDCGMSFTESSNLTKHKKKHTGELRNIVGKPCLCSVCGRGFKWASSLSKHMNHHTKRKILNCPYCPKYYVENRSLNIHLRTHTGEKPYFCNVCKKGFTQMCNLEKHLRVHTGEKPFTCPICGKGFTQSGYVTIHLRSHTGEKPYKCTQCEKSFAGSNTLAIHKRIHSGERPYSCNVCRKSFIRLESLVIHQRTHTGEKPHICTICNRGFTSSGNLKVHIRSHTGVKPYECKICEEKFIGNKGLKNHMKCHAKDQFDCDLCNMKFNELKLLEEHKLSHNPIIVYDRRLDNETIEQKY